MLVTDGLQGRPRYRAGAPLRPLRPAPALSPSRSCRARCGARSRSASAIRRHRSTSRSTDAVLAAVDRSLVDEHKRRGARDLLPALLRQSGARRARARPRSREEFPGALRLGARPRSFPFMREYERWTTTTINAYTQPMVDRYLARLETGSNALGFARRACYIMTSSGGTVTPTPRGAIPVRLLESGPAAGALMSALHGRGSAEPNVLSFDMGGTTAKGCHRPRRRAAARNTSSRSRACTSSSRAAACRAQDSGDRHDRDRRGRRQHRRGRRARRDPRRAAQRGRRAGAGLLRPRRHSADAHRRQPRARLSRSGLLPRRQDGARRATRAERAIDARGRRRRSTSSSTRAAWGIHEIINEDVARAFRIHASERGFDYRRCTHGRVRRLGPVHALAHRAQAAASRASIFPVGAGVMSALRPAREPARPSRPCARRACALADCSRADFATSCSRRSRTRPLLLLAAPAFRGSRSCVMRRLDMRYVGQGYEVEVEAAGRHADRRGSLELPRLFARSYERIFALSIEGSRSRS